MIDLGLVSSPSPSAGNAVTDVTMASFEAEVITASRSAPVIVQFWAPWCGPCKQLKPVLDKVVAAAGPAVTMVRVNIDTSPDLAQALRVQSVPTVYAFHQGQAVDGFVGVKSESELKTFVARLAALAGNAAGADETADVSAILKAADDFLAAGETTEALAQYSTAFDLAPQDMRALAGMAWCFAAARDTEAFAALLEELDSAQRTDKALAGVLWVAAEQQASQGEAGSTGAADDFSSTFAAARHQVAALDFDAAIDSLMQIIRKNRDWQDGRARSYLVALLDALGPGHPLVRPARRQLSSVLFA